VRACSLTVLTLLAVACGDDMGSEASLRDGGIGAQLDGAGAAADASSMTDGDAATGDASTADAAVPDASVPDATPPIDAAPPGPVHEHVHILIDNFCNTSASPPEITVPTGETLQLSYHNHSVDYDADVWLSYGGGYLGLETGATWDDSFEFCTSPSAYTAYADISIAGGGGSVCPKHRLLIHCQ